MLLLTILAIVDDVHFIILQLISETLLVSSTLWKTGAYDWLKCLPRILLSMLWTNCWVKLCQEHSLLTQILAPWPQKLRQEVGIRNTSEVYSVFKTLSPHEFYYNKKEDLM